MKLIIAELKQLFKSGAAEPSIAFVRPRGRLQVVVLHCDLFL